jgi:superfamily II DNA or RNA helicase
MKLEYLHDIERIKIIPETKAEYRGIKQYLNRHVEGYMHSPRFKMKLWDGRKSEYREEDDTIPIGLWKEVFKCCEEFGYPFNFINKDEFPLNREVKKKDFTEFIQTFFKGFIYKGKQFETREYQLRCALNILKNRYCNIRVPTSGGKTLIYAMYMFYLLKKYPKFKFLIIVPSTTLVSQFYDDILAFNWQNELDISAEEVFGDGNKPRRNNPDKEPNFVVGTFQSLVMEKKPYFKKFSSITVDEGHKSKANSYTTILKHTHTIAKYRWGMSGTFPDDTTYEMMKIMSNSGPVVDRVTARELIDAGYITDVHIKGVLMYHNNYQFADQLEIVASRDRKTCYDLECEKIQESEERLKVIQQIVGKCKTNTLVLFHNEDYGIKIFDYLKAENPDKVVHFINGGVSNTKRKPILKDMELTDQTRVLVASFGTLSTGVSVDAITNIIFCQSFKKRTNSDTINRTWSTFKRRQEKIIYF